MIQNKKDLKEFEKQDRAAMGLPVSKMQAIRRFTMFHLFRYEKVLRHYEYHLNKHHRILAFIYHLYWFKLGLKYRLTIPPNVFGPGLSLAHFDVLVNDHAKVGKNCRIQSHVVIGSSDKSPEAANIGDNVYLGTGVIIIGNIHIADNVVIGAGSVVVRDINEPGTTWAGVPAKKISANDSSGFIHK